MRVLSEHSATEPTLGLNFIQLPTCEAILRKLDDIAQLGLIYKNPTRLTLSNLYMSQLHQQMLQDVCYCSSPKGSFKTATLFF